MPATVTHAYFGIDVYNNLPIGLKELLMDEKKDIRMFAQGMDPFFFYHKISLKNGKKQQDFALYFHTNKTREFFINLVNYIKYNDYYQVPDVMAYLYGFISHYVLDSTIHPYVFYKTGEFIKGDKESYKYKGLHHNMEVFIDNYLINNREKGKVYSFQFYDFCFDFTPFSKELEEVIDYAFKETFGITEMSKFYKQALKDMHFALKYFRYDKTGIKKCIYTVCEKITPKTMFPFSTISYHVSLTDKRNYLNNDHTKWNHPCLKREKHEESVDELYNKALDEALSIIKKVNYYIKDTKKIDLNKVFKNLSYKTGKDCDKDYKLKYFEF